LREQIFNTPFKFSEKRVTPQPILKQIIKIQKYFHNIHQARA